MKRYNNNNYNNNDNTSFIQGKRKNRLNYTSNCHPGTVKIRKTYFAIKAQPHATYYVMFRVQ